MRLLLIEDDPLIGDGIKAGLSRQGFSVDWVTDGLVGKEAVTTGAYDAVVLDLSLPGADGIDILKHWRRSGRSEPVLVLTARDTLGQRIKGLDSGADDYLGKPFALEELAARLRALTRRSHGQAAPLLTHGNISFCQESRTVKRSGEEVLLSPKETLLVELFLNNRQSVLSKNTIENKIYPWGDEVSSNAVEVHVHHIRRKLGQDFIKTVHGLGYILGESQ